VNDASDKVGPFNVADEDGPSALPAGPGGLDADPLSSDTVALGHDRRVTTVHGYAARGGNVQPALATLCLTIGRLIRFVLLACTLVGLVAMHTLGHDAGMHGLGHSAGTHDHDQGTAIRVSTPDARAHLALPAAPGLRTGGCPGDDCPHAGLMPAEPRGGQLPGWAVCLAVISVFAMVLLAAARTLARWSGRWTGRTGNRRRIPLRAPPPLLGLRLATESVLRI
jgi:hypothetical protein